MVQEIDYDTYKTMDPATYQLLDIRDDIAVSYGRVRGAIHIPEDQVMDRLSELDRGKLLLIICAKGVVSQELAETLDSQGWNTANFRDGYNGWLAGEMNLLSDLADQYGETGPDDTAAEGTSGSSEKVPGWDGPIGENMVQFHTSYTPFSLKRKEEPVTFQQKVERSLEKKFHGELFSRFARACKTYDLIQDGDHIAVCISGGKDSFLMAKLFQQLQTHRQKDFRLTFLVMDPGYNEMNRRVIETNARILGVPITIFETKIFDAVYDVPKSPCYLCARMRRGYLYSKAQELGCNKIALGHHYDDVIETILMSMLYGGQIQTMMPKLHGTNFDRMDLIRPMYLIREDDIKHWRDYNGLHFIQCACHFTDTCTTCRPDGQGVSKRMVTKQLIAQLKKENPFVEKNIFKSVENVNLNTVIAYKDRQGVKHSFLEDF